MANIHCEHERSRLKLALDRQYRADTNEAWLDDQATIENALDRLEQAGRNRAQELIDAEKLVATWR